jgi:hypothetical protein
VKVNHHWPADREVNSSTVHRIWHDMAHFEPYVYNEINNLFLNAVCPISVMEDEHMRADPYYRKVSRTKPGELPKQEAPKFATVTPADTNTHEKKKKKQSSSH